MKKISLEEIKKTVVAFEAGDWFILAGCLAMFSRTFYRLSSFGWKNADYTHGYFILPVVLWLIFRKKESLVRTKNVSKTAITFIILSFSFYLYAGLNDFMFLDAISFVLMVWGIFFWRFTRNSCRNVLFPLTYLIFMVPPPSVAIDAITLPLRQISTYGSYLILKISQLPVEVYGSILKVGNHEMFIADACSGFRSISTLIALGALYAYFQEGSLKKKWGIFLSVVPLGIIGNIFRIVLTGLISHFFGVQYAEGFFHEASGAVLFIFTVIGLIILTEFILKRPKSEKKT